MVDRENEMFGKEESLTFSFVILNNYIIMQLVELLIPLFYYDDLINKLAIQKNGFNGRQENKMLSLWKWN